MQEFPPDTFPEEEDWAEEWYEEPDDDEECLKANDQRLLSSS